MSFPLVCILILAGLLRAMLCLVAQSCLTLYDCSPPGSSVPRLLCLGILQAKILEWVAMPSSRESSQPSYHTQVPKICISRLVQSQVAEVKRSY